MSLPGGSAIRGLVTNGRWKNLPAFGASAALSAALLLGLQGCSPEHSGVGLLLEGASVVLVARSCNDLRVTEIRLSAVGKDDIAGSEDDELLWRARSADGNPVRINRVVLTDVGPRWTTEGVFPPAPEPRSTTPRLFLEVVDERLTIESQFLHDRLSAAEVYDDGHLDDPSDYCLPIVGSPS